MKQALATAKTRVSESSSNTVADREPAPRAGGGGGGGGGMPDLASLASMMGGMGGGGGGGMPDLASLMQNPQMMQMYVLFFLLFFPSYPHPSCIRVTLTPSLQNSPRLQTDIQGTADDAERWPRQDDAKPKHQANG